MTIEEGGIESNAFSEVPNIPNVRGTRPAESNERRFHRNIQSPPEGDRGRSGRLSDEAFSVYSSKRKRVTKNLVSHFAKIGYYVVTANNGLITQQAELQKRFKRMLSTPALGGKAPFMGLFL